MGERPHLHLGTSLFLAVSRSFLLETVGRAMLSFCYLELPLLIEDLPGNQWLSETQLGVWQGLSEPVVGAGKGDVCPQGHAVEGQEGPLASWLPDHGVRRDLGLASTCWRQLGFLGAEAGCAQTSH
jgi:hypothetical protein